MRYYYALIHVRLVFEIFFFNDTATTEIYTLSLHDALPIYAGRGAPNLGAQGVSLVAPRLINVAGDPGDDDLLPVRSEEHTSELQSPDHLVCRLLLEKKKQRISSKSTVSGRRDH